jgi:muramoyltetrapeptide carboxypeptidase LdcA involved in peptidoglycan recycling
MTFAAKPEPGDRVAVVSPSGGLPEVFPAPYELGLRRLRDFGLEPVEYPTTRKLRSTPEERAADLHAAWSDPSIRAVISSIGGDDQLTVLKYLDPAVFRADPKPFFGYSDNTNLLNFLYSLGIPAFHGGSVMVQFGRGGAMHPDSERSLRAALFTSGEFELTNSGWSDRDRDWADPTFLETEPELFPATDWTWHGGSSAVTGRLPNRSIGCCATSANADCSNASRRCCGRARRHGRSTTSSRPPTAPVTPRTSTPRSAARSRSTTPRLFS